MPDIRDGSDVGYVVTVAADIDNVDVRAVRVS